MTMINQIRLSNFRSKFPGTNVNKYFNKLKFNRKYGTSRKNGSQRIKEGFIKCLYFK